VPYALNVLYFLLLAAASPYLLYRCVVTGKYRRGLFQKFFGLAPHLPPTRKRRVWFHAVSVGEVLLLRPILARLRHRQPNWECVLSVSTETGFDIARRTFPELTIFWFPFDFSWAVRRALKRIQPRLVVLAELELWPNFIQAAKASGARVAVVNGRISPKSFRNYSRIRWFMNRLLKQLDLLAVQTPEYADRMHQLGAPAERIYVTGSVKFDGLLCDPRNYKSQQLARLLGLEEIAGEPAPLVWVVGSTQDPEERLALQLYKKLKADFPELRLVLVPRHKERFDEVAQLITAEDLPLLRRSQADNRDDFFERDSVVLLDSIGELGALWGVADVAFVGGSLSRRGGQNMIEPAAFGKAVTFGPNVWNFRDVAERLLENRGAIQIRNALEWEQVTRRLLGYAEERAGLGLRAQEYVLKQQGASERTIEALEALLQPPSRIVAAA
jgi:3-deoxy-D-manno-octulosonic-acid transferase